MFRIRKLDIFIARQFALLFVGTFFICQFVLMMQFLWRYIDELIGKGLTVDVLAQFFWYMALMLVPQALPLAILLSSLITMGNLGESSELTAIKASGISLLQACRSLIAITVVIMLGSFYFENHVGPQANMKIMQLLVSMKQKSPELEIPEGVFYDGIPQSNIYVQKKDPKSGKLYGIMIYRMTGSYEDQAIILADSGMLQATAEKKHLVLRLWSGKWFENMQRTSISTSAAVPYQRETFVEKQIVIDYDADFNITDASSLSNNARGKGLREIRTSLDSLRAASDSMGRSFYRQMQMFYFRVPQVNKADSLMQVRLAAKDSYRFDTLYRHLNAEQRQAAVDRALQTVQSELNDLEFKAMMTAESNKVLRVHEIEIFNIYTLALLCLIFFFIGAPLGAIIRKGGLGVPVIISVLVFIVYYILDNSGYRMARGGMWSVVFGKSLAPAVLIPLAVFFTYKANNDSVVFNVELYRDFFMKLLGLRLKRHIAGKEVVIRTPDYAADKESLQRIAEQVSHYSHTKRLYMMPNVWRVFFVYRPDHVVEQIAGKLEAVIEDLSNTRDAQILQALNEFPILSVKAHTRPFDRRWLNVAAAVVLPIGVVLYVRMWMFRLRLYRDLRSIGQTIEKIIKRMEQMEADAPIKRL